MTQDLRVALTTSLNDRLVGPLRRSLDEIEKNLKDIEKELTGVTRNSEKAGQALSGMQGPAQAAKQVVDLAKQTQNAIGLAEKLKNAWASAGTTIRGVSSAVGAFQAAKYVMGAPLQQARSYDRQLADASNTAFSDRDTAGRRAGMGELNTIVTDSLRAGGGKREEVLAALNEMLNSGAVSSSQAKNLLPTVTKYASAGNASVTDLSNIVVKALQTGFKEADIPKILDMALAAGQKGGFELKDMAQWLPKLLAAGKMSGLNGMEGYARILASAQGSAITAGSKAEAGNNLLNLLLKINSSDTANDAKKLGIDLSGSLAAARGKGVNSLDAFVNLVDKIAGADPRMVALRKQAAGAGNDEERKATLESQADILQGSSIGKIVQDRQALLSLVAELNKREYIQGVKSDVMGANGQYGASNFELIKGTADFRVNQMENEKLFAQNNGLGGANEALGKLAEGATNLYREYPGYATVVETAKWAIGGMAAAATGAGAVLGLFSFFGKGGGAAAAAAASAAQMAGGGSAVATGAAGAGMVGAAGVTSVATGGLLASLFATNVVANNADAFSTMSADSGDTAFAAAIMSVAKRPIVVQIDGREIATAVNNENSSTARRN